MEELFSSERSPRASPSKGIKELREKGMRKRQEKETQLHTQIREAVAERLQSCFVTVGNTRNTEHNHAAVYISAQKANFAFVQGNKCGGYVPSFV